MARILIVEDNSRLAKGLAINLEGHGHEVLTTGGGKEAIRLAVEGRPQLILLDIGLKPRSPDGLEVCRELRRREVDAGIIMLTEANTELEVVAGLEAGADDYVTKPFSLALLLARIHAQLRRQTVVEQCTFGDVEVDFARGTAARGGRPLDLTQAEMRILRLLFQHRGKVITRERILRDALGYDDASATRTIDTHILNLRKKVEADPTDPCYIITIHGDGYRFSA